MTKPEELLILFKGKRKFALRFDYGIFWSYWGTSNNYPRTTS